MGQSRSIRQGNSQHARHAWPPKPAEGLSSVPPTSAGRRHTRSMQQCLSPRQENNRMFASLIKLEPRPETGVSSRSNRKWGGSTKWYTPASRRMMPKDCCTRLWWSWKPPEREAHEHRREWSPKVSMGAWQLGHHKSAGNIYRKGDRKRARKLRMPRVSFILGIDTSYDRL